MTRVTTASTTEEVTGQAVDNEDNHEIASTTTKVASQESPDKDTMKKQVAEVGRETYVVEKIVDHKVNNSRRYRYAKKG